MLLIYTSLGYWAIRCHPTRDPRLPSRPQTATTAPCPILISRPAEGRRRTVTHHCTTNRARRRAT